MPKRRPTESLQAIVNAVARLPDGGSIEAISRALEVVSARRTLQRHLAILVRQGRLVREGRGQATRYRTPATPLPVPATATVSLRDDYVIPISAAGAAIIEIVSAPIQRRHPVGYNRAFLDDYEPNVTVYLAPEARRHLAELGESPDRDQPAGTYARKMHERLLIDLSWNSSRLEGNTYSLLETERLLELGESADAKDAREAQMILNHKAAIELLIDQAEHVGFNRYTVLNLHALLAENLLADSAAWGRLRTAAVDIGGSTYHPPAVPQLIDECFGQMLHKADAIDDPFEQAFFGLVHLPYLQPFLDVNKRVSRLVANLPLVRANLCPLSFVDVPTKAYVNGLLGVYEQNRVELLRDVFCWAYERSCARYSAIRQSLGEPDAFRSRHRGAIIDTIAEVVRDRLDKQHAHAHVVDRSTALPAADAARFVEIVEADLSNLHEGNIARARLAPSEFNAWQAQWR